MSDNIYVQYKYLRLVTAPVDAWKFVQDMRQVIHALPEDHIMWGFMDEIETELQITGFLDEDWEPTPEFKKELCDRGYGYWKV